ncbi:MAG: purine-nucleoside phosphorylase [Bacteroidota bacterium]
MKSILRKEILEKYSKSAEFVHNHFLNKISTAIIAGSGFGELFGSNSLLGEISYSQIPNFPQPTAKGHKGKLLFVEIRSVPCMVFSGRFHFYEGFSVEEVASVSVLSSLLGIEKMIYTNSAGGLNQFYNVGDCVIIRDTINLLYRSEACLFEKYEIKQDIFSRSWNDKLAKNLADSKIPFQEGIYLSTLGPTYETPAEIRFFRRIGADCAGMSTIIEAKVASQLGIENLGISIITNKLVEVATSSLSHEDVLIESSKALPVAKQIIEEAVKID